MTIPTTAELLLRADWQRPRSQQKGLGMSDLGGCRRQAGYKLHGQQPEKPSGSVQAVIGTAVHDTADVALRMMRDAGLIPASSVINEEVKFGGLTGHPDLYVDGVLRDIKTVGYDAQVASYQLNGPPKRHLWQVMTYAAALIVTDRPVHVVQLDYLVRDSGNSWLWEGPFDYDQVREAMLWLDLVRQTPLEWLARDYAPDSVQCSHCFSGETKYWTRDGLRTFADTVGTYQEVLTSRKGGLGGQGRWEKAEIRSFGQQQLYALEVKRDKITRTIYTTAGHRWMVRNKNHRSTSGTRQGPLSERIITTEKLQPGHVLESLLPKRDGRLQPSPFGIAHGIVYGDGTRERKNSVVDLWGEKNTQLLRFFTGCKQVQIETPSGIGGVKVSGLPGFFKNRPQIDEGASYLYGWLAGYFAADGHVSGKGQARLDSAVREDLEFAQLVAARLGMGTSDISARSRVGINGKTSMMYTIRFTTSSLAENFFIVQEHLRRFQSTPRRNGTDVHCWKVVSVKPTDRTEEVYCAVVPETESFVLDGWIHTMNCPFFNACWDGHVLDRDERSVLLVEDGDAVAWAVRLEEARARLKEAKAAEALAKGALDALRPNSEGRGEVALEGFPKVLRWTVSKRRNLDSDQVRADYARNGAQPPLTASTSVKLDLVPDPGKQGRPSSSTGPGSPAGPGT